jgi:hypothetical protein
MSTQIQRRRGTTAEHSTFTGVEGEITVDTTKDTAVVHDGTTVGGHPLQKQYPPLGSAAAPTYTFTGDTNTGIYSPGADQVAVATNGTGRLFIDASGRVGIAGSPSASSNTYLQVGYAGIGSDHVAYNYDSYFANNLYKSANSAWSRISTRAGGLLRIDDDTFTYSTADSGTAGASATLSERLRITSAGLVGIGTSSPVFNLVVAGSGSDGAWFNSSGTVGRMGLGAIAVGSGGAFQISYDRSSGLTNFGVGTRDTPSTAFTIDSSGRLGIGTTSPNTLLNIKGSVPRLMIQPNADDQTPTIQFANAAGSSRAQISGGGVLDSALVFTGTGLERARIDSSGRLLVGTSTARSNFFNTAQATALQLEGTGTAGASFSITSNQADGAGAPFLILGRTNSGSVGGNGLVSDGNQVGAVSFQAADGSELVPCASISANVDGTPGANDMPGRLVFSTTADGASSPTERMRITQNGYTKHSNNGVYLSNTAAYHEFSSNDTQPGIVLRSTNASFANNVVQVTATRAADSAYRLFAGYSNIFYDLEFGLYGDGNGKCDGAWSGGGADYAEYFEWSDDNPNAEDRRGISVVLDGGKIREALTGEDPIGAISGNPSVVGDAAWNKWSGKYLRDEFGTYIQEGYEVEDEDGNTVIQQRRKLNPAYDPDVEYISREQRPEWDCVGLMGKLRIRKGQATGARWIKMRDINDSVEEWLVR